MANTRVRCAAASAVTFFLGGSVSAGTALAQPPGFCGAHEDPFVCTARNDAGPPTAAESAYLALVRGHAPGSDAKLLNAGRTVCEELRNGGAGNYVHHELASYLGSDDQSAGQVLDAAILDICPGVHVS